MCRLSGIRLKKVTIASEENTAGSCGYEKMIRGKYPETDNSDRMRLKLEKRAMIALAGPIAQKLFSPRSFRNYHASADFKAAVDMALLVNGSAKQAEAWLKWLEICTRETLQARWSIVEGLAEELLRTTTLNGEQVQQFVAEFLRLVAVRGKTSISS